MYFRMLFRRAGWLAVSVSLAAVMLLSLHGLVRAQDEVYRITAITLSGGSVYGVNVGAADCTWNGAQFRCSNDHSSGTGSKYSGVGGLIINSSVPVTERAGIAITIVYTKSAPAEYYSVFSEAYTTQMFRHNEQGAFSRVHCVAHEPYWDALPGSLPSTAELLSLLHDDGVECDRVIYRTIQWNSEHYLGVRSRELSWEFNVTEIGVIHLGDADGDDDGGGYGQIITGDVEYAGGYCVLPLTTTQVISDGGETITQTTVTTYTRPVNLLSNWSFETAAGAMPEHWGTVVNGAVQNVPGVWWISNPAYANSGSRSVSNIADFMVVQSLPLYSAGRYVAGFYARCTDGACDPAQARWDGLVVAASLAMSTTYQVYTGTHLTGGGGASFAIDLTLGGNVYVDDVFVYPANEDGSVNCDPAFFAPPDEEPGGSAPPGCVVDPLTNQCIWAPSGPAGTVCYHCATPSPASPVQLWLAWLGCVLRNMFSCSLRVWLFEIANALRGMMASINMAVNWANGNFQRGVNWQMTQFNGLIDLAVQAYNRLAAFMAAVPQQITVIVYTVIGEMEGGIDWLQLIFEIVKFLFDLLIVLLRQLYNGLLALIELIISSIKSVQISFTAPAFTIEEFVDWGAPDGTDLIPGATTAAAMHWFFLALATVDVTISDIGLWPVIYTAMGVLGIGMVFWFVSQWKDDIFPM